MKTTIKNIALLLAAGFPVAAVAGTLGAPLPASVTLESGLGAFTLAFSVLLLIADYSRPALKRLPVTAPAAVPAAARAGESHRLAA